MDAPRSGEPPQASWILGRSARWRTPAGQALLAEGPQADLKRELRRFAGAMRWGIPHPWLFWRVGCTLVRVFRAER